MSVQYLPPTRELPTARIDTMRAELEAFVARPEPATRWWRKRRNVTGGLVVALIVATGGGTAAAYAYLHPRAVTNKGYARCYTEPVYARGSLFPGTTVATAVGEGRLPLDLRGARTRAGYDVRRCGRKANEDPLVLLELAADPVKAPVYFPRGGELMRHFEPRCCKDASQCSS